MSRWLRLIRWYAARLPKKQIGYESLYLERHYICRGAWSLFLHRFHRPDSEPSGTLHTHPWKWSVAFVLSAGYTEERLTSVLRQADRVWEGSLVDKVWRERFPSAWYVRRARPFRLNIFLPGDAHRIAELHGEVWTLFLVGPKVASWGFLVPGEGFVEVQDDD